MTDIHSHILPFVDDGSDSYEKSIEMLKKHISQGVKNVVLTPHFRMGSFALGNDKIIEEFNNFKTTIQKKIYSLTTKLLDVLHIPYNWHQANDPDFAIDKARQHLNKNKSRDDLER